MPRRSGLMSGGAEPEHGRDGTPANESAGQQGKTNFGLNLPRHPSTLRGRVGDLPPESHSPSRPRLGDGDGDRFVMNMQPDEGLSLIHDVSPEKSFVRNKDGRAAAAQF